MSATCAPSARERDELWDALESAVRASVPRQSRGTNHRARRRREELTVALWHALSLVLDGIRGAHLFDTVAVDAQLVASVIRHKRMRQIQDCTNALVVIDLNGQTFLARRDVFSEETQRQGVSKSQVLVPSENLRFVAVSLSSSRDLCLVRQDGEVHSKTRDTLELIRQTIGRSLLSQTGSTLCAEGVKIERADEVLVYAQVSDSTEWILPALAGWWLGYPLVYVRSDTRPDDGERFECTTLQLFGVWSSTRNLRACPRSSQPRGISRRAPSESDVRIELCLGDEHEAPHWFHAFGFSLPSECIDALESNVHEWLDRVRRVWKDSPRTFASLSLRVERSSFDVATCGLAL